MSPAAHEITRLLQAWSAGDESALEHLVPLLYKDLHRVAKRCMAQERPDHTLQATALVHEACVRLLAGARPTWQDRAHFIAVCARIMRRILVDSARFRKAVKRDVPLVQLEEAPAGVAKPGTDLVALDEALTELAALDKRKSQVVEMRFFGGLSVKETAAVLKVSEETVMRDWKLAKSWLRRELKKERSDGS